MSSKRARRTLMKSHAIQRKFLEENPQHVKQFTGGSVERYGMDVARQQAEADLRKIEGMEDEINNNRYWDELKTRPGTVHNTLGAYAMLILQIRNEKLMPWFMERHKEVTDLITAISRDVRDFTTCCNELEKQHAGFEGRCDMNDMELYFRLEAEYSHLLETIYAMLQPYGVYLGNEIDFALARRARYAVTNGLWSVGEDNTITVVKSVDEHLAELGVEQRDVGKMSLNYRNTVPAEEQPAADKFQNAEMPDTSTSGIQRLNDTPNQMLELVDDLSAERNRAASMMQQNQVQALAD